MKGAEQLARSCRRLGREGVGPRRAGTRTRAARAPRSPPQTEGSRARPAPPRPAAAALAPRGAGGSVCVCACACVRTPDGCLASLPPGFVLWFQGWGFLVFFWKSTDPLFGAVCPWLPPLLRFFASFICGCGWQLLLLVLLIAPGPFLALCGSAV